MSSLREHTQAMTDHLQVAAEHAELARRRDREAAGTRRRLYGLITALAALADEAGGYRGLAEPAPGNGEGPARTVVSRRPD